MLKHPFIPPAKKTFLFIGQDIDNIQSYLQEVSSDCSGFMAYTSLVHLEGLWDMADPGGGRQYLAFLAEKYPNLYIQLGLYIVGVLEQIIRGYYKDNLVKLGQWLSYLSRPVFLRIGYEFDGPHNAYSPGAYKRAYRIIRDTIEQYAKNKIAYVWHSYAAYTQLPISEWYPGDEYVDWIGLSLFGQPNKYVERIINFAQDKNKPVMIAEATPRGKILENNAAWEEWFEPVFQLIEHKDIKAFCYINANWEEQKMWKGQNWKDSRIQINPIIKKKWLKRLSLPRYSINKKVTQ